jgi:hypothetical protein
MIAQRSPIVVPVLPRPAFAAKSMLLSACNCLWSAAGALRVSAFVFPAADMGIRQGIFQQDARAGSFGSKRFPAFE